MVTPGDTDIFLFTALNFDGGPALDWVMYQASERLTWLPFYVFILWLVYKNVGPGSAVALTLGLIVRQIGIKSFAAFFLIFHKLGIRLVALFLTWVMFRKLGARAAITFFVVCAMMITCADQTASLCKDYMPKYRPTHYDVLAGQVHTVYGYTGGLYGTVSSHAANAMALMILAGLTLKRRWLWWAMSVWVALMSYSRIYLGVHYPMDILLGLVEGAFWGIVWWLILRKLLSLRFITK